MIRPSGSESDLPGLVAAIDPKQAFVHCLGLLDSLPFKAGGASD
jgi:hypothetical protein